VRLKIEIVPRIIFDSHYLGNNFLFSHNSYLVKLLSLNPLGHFGFIPLTFLDFLPLTQVIVFLVGATVPVIITVAVDEIGARVDVPGWVAVTEQLPLFSRFRVEPVIEQLSVVEVVYKSAPPLEEIAVSSTVLLERFTDVGNAKVIVWGSRVTSKEALYKSDAK
jgi:hypothetical protein